MKKREDIIELNEPAFSLFPEDATAGEIIDLLSQLPTDTIITNPKQNVFKAIPVDKNNQPLYPIHEDYEEDTEVEEVAHSINDVLFEGIDKLDDIYINEMTNRFRDMLELSVAHQNAKHATMECNKIEIARIIKQQ